MAITHAYEILIDNTDQDKRAEYVTRTLQALIGYTRTVTYAATYAAGSTSVNQASIQLVGVGAVDVGIRVTMDSAVVGTDEVPEILRKIIAALAGEVLLITYAASYVLGDRTYNVNIALS